MKPVKIFLSILMLILFVFCGLGQNKSIQVNNAIDKAVQVAKMPKPLYPVSQTSKSSQLWNNGTIVTHPGQGVGGADYSWSYNGTHGIDCRVSLGNSIATKFYILDASWQIDSIILFAYQPFSDTISTINDVRIRIWNGDPSLPSSNVVWGDLTTNRLTTSYWSHVYRGTDFSSTDRPIMRIKCATAGLTLNQSYTYYLEYRIGSTIPSGPLSPPIGSGEDIQFSGSTNTWYNLNLKFPIEIYGTATPLSCPIPNALTANNITTTSANISWSSGGNATMWEVEWGPAGFTIGDGTQITGLNTPNTVLTGLTHGTEYTFYARSYCPGYGFSDWSLPYTFQTLCDVFNTPFTEGFEGNTFPPPCWTKIDGGGSWDVVLGTGAYNLSTKSVIAPFFDIMNNTPFDIITLNFNASTLSNPKLKFDYAYATYTNNEVDQLDIYYSTNGGTTYNLLMSMPGGSNGILNTGGASSYPFVPNASQWKTAVISLPAGTNKIKFSAISAYGNNLYVDNITIKEVVPPTINPVSTTYNLSSPGNVSTTISWNDAIQIVSITDNQSTPYTLIANTDYNVSGNTLTINSSYLNSVLHNVNDVVVLNILFNESTTLTFTITAIQDPPQEYVIAHWTFENATKRGQITDNATFLSNPYTADDGISANINVAPITLGGGSVFSGWVTGSGSTGTYACNANTWNGGTNTKYWMVTISTLGYENLKLSSKQRSSSTGPRDFKVQYSTNGTNWTDVPNTTLVVQENFTSGVLNDVPLPNECNNQNSLRIRWIMTSETAVNQGAVGTTGTNRIDDILIKGTNIIVGIPEQNPNIAVYPNPISNEFYIETQKDFLLKITDITGRLLGEQFIHEGVNRIQFNDKPSGIYLLFLFNDNESRTFKIIKR